MNAGQPTIGARQFDGFSIRLCVSGTTIIAA
jgi:hypothetical protein